MMIARIINMKQLARDLLTTSALMGTLASSMAAQSSGMAGSGLSGIESGAAAMDLTREEDLMSSLSIVGYDPATGDVGICMASKFFAVGPVAAYVRADVGAIAVMGEGPFKEGDRLLDWLEEGLSPPEVLARLRSEYPLVGQLNIVDTKGRSVSTTGPNSSLWKGHRFGPNYATAGNILAGPQVVDAFADIFEATEGQGLPLAERLLRSCEAAHAVGGDGRGMQGAQLKVSRAGAGFRGTDLLVDLRVDDSTNSIEDLRQLWEEWKFHHLYGVGFQPIEQTTGRDVQQLQRHLLTLGYVDAADRAVFDASGQPNGTYNDATSEGLMRWKRDHGYDASPNLVPYMLRDLEAQARASGGGR